MGARNPWLLCHRRRAHPAARVICFPYAGGGASVYAPWRETLAQEIELLAVQLPGREARFKEAPLEQFHVDLLPALHAGLQFADDVPCWLFGHSLGALLAFETARRAAASGGMRVAGLIVSGCEAPSMRGAREPLHHLPDDAFINKLAELNGTPSPVLANRPLMDLLLPMIRADFALADSYRYSVSAPLTVPMAVFLGMEDCSVSSTAATGWASETTGTCRTHTFPGDHFFIHQSRDDIIKAVGRFVLDDAA